MAAPGVFCTCRTIAHGHLRCAPQMVVPPRRRRLRERRYITSPPKTLSCRSGTLPEGRAATPCTAWLPLPGCGCSSTDRPDRSVPTTVYDTTGFLYTGTNPIQTGVAPGTIEPLRAAVVRGQVLTREGAPLPGVMITVLDRPEFGETLSHTDGMFDLAVNGGETVTVRYEKTGVLLAQRQVSVPWQDFDLLPDVALIPLDAQVTAIDLIGNIPVQVSQGSVVSDADGTR